MINGATSRFASVSRYESSVQALMAMLERYAYFLVSRRLDFDADAMLDTVTHIVHRGFFGASLEAV